MFDVTRRRFLETLRSGAALLFGGPSQAASIGARAGRTGPLDAIAAARAVVADRGLLRGLSQIADQPGQGLAAQAFLDMAAYNLALPLRADQQQNGALSAAMETLVQGLDVFIEMRPGEATDELSGEAREGYQAALHEASRLLRLPTHLVEELANDIALGKFGRNDLKDPRVRSHRSGSYDPFDFLFRREAGPILSPAQLLRRTIQTLIESHQGSIQRVVAEKGDPTGLVGALLDRLDELNPRSPYGEVGEIPNVRVRMPEAEGGPVLVEVRDGDQLVTYDGERWSSEADPAVTPPPSAPTPRRRPAGAQRAVASQRSTEPPKRRVVIDEDRLKAMENELTRLRSENNGLKNDNAWLEWAQGTDIS